MVPRGSPSLSAYLEATKTKLRVTWMVTGSASISNPSLLYLCLNWPEKLPLPPNQQEVKEKEISLIVVTQPSNPIISIDKFSYDHLKRVTAWIIRFIRNSQTRKSAERNKGYLTTTELQTAEIY